MSEEIVTKVPYEEMDLDQRLTMVDLLVLELENVLTDGGVEVDAEGRETIVISQRDAYGLAMWREAGFHAVVIARKDLGAARAWAEARDIPFRVHTGAKAPALQAIIFEHESHPQKLCYLGAEMDDLPAMMIAGVAACTADAPRWVRGGSELVLESPGGAGAVRELVEHLLALRRAEGK